MNSRRLRPLDEPTIREKVEGAMRRKLSSDQTAELALDDLGLELGSLEQTDSQIGLKPVGGMPRGPDANAPTMVAGLDENSQRLLAAAAARHAACNGDDSQLTEHGASGTWFLTERELGGDVDLTKGRSIDPNSTASMAKFEMPEEGFDISSTSRLAAIDRNNLDFPVEPTQQQPAVGRGKVDLDLGNGLRPAGQPHRRARGSRSRTGHAFRSRHQARPGSRLRRHGRPGRRAQHPQRSAGGRFRFAEDRKRSAC